MTVMSNGWATGAASAQAARCMRRLATLALLLPLVAGCADQKRVKPKQALRTSDMQTIDSSDAAPAPINPPPMVTDEGPAPKPKANVAQADAPPPPTAADEALRAALPFAPAIAMDPVDGSKISIRADTPQIDLKNRIYYFRSDENKRIFAANPDQFTKGLFSHL